jgi:NADPH:quinone reductase-like Zn-dependent oxidoreductase
MALGEAPAPVAGPGEVVLDVAAAGVNRADLMQRAGRYPAPAGWPPDVPGLEFAGTVAETGPVVSSIRRGDRVFGIVGGGAHATHLVTTEALCASVPQGLDLIEAGSVPEAYITAHDALTRAGLRPGARVLIHAVGSGVGTAAVQIACALGATTVGTSRTPDKLDRARRIGLDEGVVAGDDMADRIGEVDIVIDLVGGRYVETDVAVCRPRGTIIVVGLLAGGSSMLDLEAVLRRRLTVAGTVLRNRAEHEKAGATALFAAEVVPLLERRLLRPVVHDVVPFTEAERAYDAVASNRTFGKVVMAMESR